MIFKNIIAKSFLKKIEGEYVTVETKNRDRYGRIVAVLFYMDDNVNVSMVRNGFAWAYKRYLNNVSTGMRKKYFSAESFAKESRLGLWREDDSIPPWEWRKQSRRKK